MTLHYKREKERDQYTALLTEQVWSRKSLLYRQTKTFCGTKAGNPEGTRRAHLAPSGDQQIW